MHPRRTACRQVRADAAVTGVVAQRYPYFSVRGLPLSAGGETPAWHALAHGTQDALEQSRMRLLLNHWAMRIDPVGYEVCGPWDAVHFVTQTRATARRGGPS